MATTPNSYLKPDPNVILRDARHASRLFVDDNFRLAPKFKFLYHVAISINPAALRDISLVQRHRNEIGLLAKSVDLPNFRIQTETLNQYNRKKNVQFGHKPEPITIKFHDDNMGLINHVWQNYYSYYFADSLAAAQAGAYSRNATKSSDYISNSYGLDNNSALPFFNYITIYQMARHEYVSYKLINPLITAWNHNNVDYANTALHDNTMQISYEAVSYGVGKVVPGDPEGFGFEHYDQTPSPLTSVSNIESSSPSFVNNQNIANNAGEYLNNLTTSINSYENTQPLPDSGTSGILGSVLKTVQQGVGGIQGLIFPVSAAVSASSGIVASIRNLF